MAIRAVDLELADNLYLSRGNFIFFLHCFKATRVKIVKNDSHDSAYKRASSNLLVDKTY